MADCGSILNPGRVKILEDNEYNRLVVLFIDHENHRLDIKTALQLLYYGSRRNMLVPGNIIAQ